MKHNQLLSCEDDDTEDNSQKLPVPLFASQNHAQMHLDPVQAGIRAGMSNEVARC